MKFMVNENYFIPKNDYGQGHFKVKNQGQILKNDPKLAKIEHIYCHNSLYSKGILTI